MVAAASAAEPAAEASAAASAVALAREQRKPETSTATPAAAAAAERRQPKLSDDGEISQSFYSLEVLMAKNAVWRPCAGIRFVIFSSCFRKVCFFLCSSLSKNEAPLLFKFYIRQTYAKKIETRFERKNEPETH